MTGNEVVQARRERAACPVVTGAREMLERRGVLDAQDLAWDVQHIEPAQLWGRLALWREEDPERLYMVVVALAAMLPLDLSPGAALAWCGKHSGLATFQPGVREMRRAA